MSADGSFPHAYGRPFTLWQNPDRWPVPPLKLPGRAFTLWQDPARWPQRISRLPGLGHTLWLDPASWPTPLLRLPGAGFSLWLNPGLWPEPVASALPALSPPLVMPIQIPRNHAFTLWTRPSLVTPIAMRNGLTALQLAAGSPQNPLPAAVLFVRNGDAASAPDASATMPFLHRMVPLAAGVVAVLGLHALMSIANSKKLALRASESTAMNQRENQAGKELDELRAERAKAASDAAEKTAQSEAKALVLKEENARLVTRLTQAEEAIRKTEGTVVEQGNLMRDLTKQAEEARLEASKADTNAQGLVVAAVEEASAIKRESAAEVVKLRESLALLEAEKAAALKAAAIAIQEKAAAQAALDASRKPTP